MTNRMSTPPDARKVLLLLRSYLVLTKPLNHDIQC